MPEPVDVQLVAYLDGELETADCRVLEAHLATDPVAAARLAALADVRRAVDCLPPEQRSALLLITVDGLSYREADAVMCVPICTICRIGATRNTRYKL